MLSGFCIELLLHVAYQLLEDCFSGNLSSQKQEVGG